MICVTGLAADIRAAEAAKRAGMGMAEGGAGEEWMAAARAAIEETARALPHFTSEDVARRHPELLEDPAQVNPSALGPAMQAAAREGLIEPTMIYRESGSKASHRRPKKVWNSLVHSVRAGQEVFA